MKKTGILSAALLVVTLSVGCCHKDLCLGSAIREIRFYGFASQELDTVYLETYTPDGPVSQGNYQWIREQEDQGAYSRVSFSFNTDLVPDETVSYRISLPQVNRVFEITDLTYVDDHCKSGMCRQDFRSLESYTVNGQPQQLQDHALVLTH